MHQPFSIITYMGKNKCVRLVVWQKKTCPLWTRTKSDIVWLFLNTSSSFWLFGCFHINLLITCTTTIIAYDLDICFLSLLNVFNVCLSFVLVQYILCLVVHLLKCCTNTSHARNMPTRVALNCEHACYRTVHFNCILMVDSCSTILKGTKSTSSMNFHTKCFALLLSSL